MVAVKDRTNACKNPYAHLHEPDWTLEKAMESPMLWDPVRFIETCPSSDGAAALVITNEKRADAHAGPKAWIHATAMRSEPTMFAGRNQSARGGRDVRGGPVAQGRHHEPGGGDRRRRDVRPFAWFEPMWLENLGFAAKDEGWRWVEDGRTDLTGDLPINPSGGVLSTNPSGPRA